VQFFNHCYLRKALPYLLILSTLLFSCRSKKETTSNSPKKKSKELETLSTKLNLEVEKEDNFNLYQYVGEWLGTPHQLGSCQKSAIDCSCFVLQLYESVYGIKLPRTASEMFKQSNPIERNKLDEGDLVFFSIKSSKVSHVGIYLKQGWFAHVSTSKGVMINNLEEGYYQKYFTGGGRYGNRD